MASQHTVPRPRRDRRATSATRLKSWLACSCANRCLRALQRAQSGLEPSHCGGRLVEVDLSLCLARRDLVQPVPSVIALPGRILQLRLSLGDLLGL